MSKKTNAKHNLSKDNANLNKTLVKPDEHEFSLYTPDLASIEIQQDTFILENDVLYHRIVRVLRLKTAEVLTLFDCNYHIRVKLLSIDKKNRLSFKVTEKAHNRVFKPSITFFLPLLKREALQQAVYSLVELGTNEIFLMETQKSSHQWKGKDEYDRLHAIMISAAEQSKVYRFPVLHPPQPFSTILSNSNMQNCNYFFCDPNGQDLLPLLKSVKNNMTSPIAIMIGPEGDLTQSEKEELKAHHITFVRLTPTVLRAQQAVVVIVGIFRSLLGINS